MQKKMSIFLTHFPFFPVFWIKIQDMKGTVLIVDDNMEVLNVLKKIVKHEFETVLTLSNPNTIIEILRRTEVDIVMIDMNFRSRVHNGNEGLFWMIRSCSQP